MPSAPPSMSALDHIWYVLKFITFGATLQLIRVTWELFDMDLSSLFVSKTYSELFLYNYVILVLLYFL